VVSVAHPSGLRTTYEPVSPAVRAGQQVTAGSVLGALLPGHAGCPAAACLHWGLLRGETYLDPLSLLAPRHLRLLPPGGAPDG
jgi:murein DD-endopeptidase MepM/ murein hydrolase activator NlpD